jgi:hypothetical protein
VRIGPPPLYPAYPLRPDRQEVYPRALGEVFVGNPRLDLPDVKARVPEAKDPWKVPESRSEATLAWPKNADLLPGPSPLDAQGPGKPRPPVGSLFDVKA